MQALSAHNIIVYAMIISLRLAPSVAVSNPLTRINSSVCPVLHIIPPISCALKIRLWIRSRFHLGTLLLPPRLLFAVLVFPILPHLYYVPILNPILLLRHLLSKHSQTFIPLHSYNLLPFRLHHIVHLFYCLLYALLHHMIYNRIFPTTLV